MVTAVFAIWCTMAASPFGVILKLLMREFNSGRGMVSLMLSIYAVVGGVSSFFIGRLLERHQPQKFLLWGSIIGGIGFLLCSQARSLWHLYVLYFFLGAVLSAAGAIPIVTLISKWFTRRRGQAVGISLAGMSIGGMFITPIVGLIAENFGWRATYLFAGSLMLAVSVPLNLLIIRHTPEEMGLLPDGVEPAGVANTPAVNSTGPNKELNSTKTRLAEYLRHLPLWLICLGFPFSVMGNMAIFQHEVSFLTDMKISATLAASAFGFTAGIGGIGSLVSGWLSDRVSPRYVAMMFFSLALAGVYILMHTTTMPMVWLFVVVYGIGSGASGTLLPLVIRDIFGPASFSVLFGFVNILYTIGIAAGVPLAGFIFDATGSYSLVFNIVTMFYAVAIAAVYFVYGVRPRQAMHTNTARV